ncbi:MAG: hypothetical protein J3R72DRAFT_439726 [Linnemannia gamsii]|nr:MAG: hypothetical protein J3R72DRAFT_439726 [Linnemannia gamsii]
MSNKKITPNQMRKNLTYVQEGAPDFMRMLTGQSASSAANNDPRNPYRKPIGIEAKFQSDQPGDDEDDDETAHDILNEREEERPTVVVLKDGKHLDERQVKNILNNLPAGLSEAEIEKRLASALETNNAANKESQEEEEESEDDQVPIDANGKILFRRPKGSKPKSTSSSITSSSTKSDKSITSTASKKNFENTILAEAEAKVNALKKNQQSGSNSSTEVGAGAEAGTGASEGSKRKANDNNSKDSRDSSNTSAPKKKKLQKKTTTSLLSFNDDE